MRFFPRQPEHHADATNQNPWELTFPYTIEIGMNSRRQDDKSRWGGYILNELRTQQRPS
jgi:hypothetical protein